MAYLLQFPAATAYVNTGRLIFGAGYSVTFDIQRDSDVNIYLSSDTGDELRYIVGTGWQIRISNVYYTYNEPELTPPIGSRFTVTFSRDGSTSTRGVSLNSGTVYTRTTGSGNLWVNNLGQGAGGAYQAFKLYKCTFTQPVDAGGYNRVFDPDASGGSGSLLINTLTNTNNGALTGAGWSIPACWVFYSSGASNVISVSANLPKLAGSLTLNEINPSYVISVSGQLPKLTGAVALNETNPVFSVSVAGQLPKLTGTVALNQFANTRQAAVNGILPKLTASVTLNRLQPNNQADVSGNLPRLTASITLRSPESYPTANPNDYTVNAYLSTDSTYTARLSGSTEFNAIISASSTFNARLN